MNNRRSLRIARAIILSLVLALGAGATTGCVVRPARPAVTVTVRHGPPPPRREVVVVRPSHRHVWVTGHWAWRHRDWVWVAGAWKVPPRGKKVWVAPRYEKRRGGWVFIAGYWR